MAEASRSMMGACTECGEAREVWPELVRGTAVCRCGSKTFTLETAMDEAPIRGEEAHRQPLEPMSQ